MTSDRWLRLLVTLLVLSVAALAQDTGQITGSVKDPSGASVANAQVTVSSPERGINRATQTNSDGDYLVGGLPSGAYDLNISASGFRNYSAKGIVLRIGGKNRADATLQVGAASTEITVEGQNIAQVETQSSDLAGTVTGKQITQLQLNGRNFTQLATLVPGVSNQTGQDEGTVGVYGNVAFSFNGGRTEYNNWELDGGDNMDNGSNATLNVYPSIDAIGEVRVLTSNYGAQYGRNGSGTVETEIKSGTSGFHGSVYEFVRNEAFNARNYFQSKVPTYKKNDYGYNVGGPIFIPGVYNTKKDKSFFFWSQEWRKDRVPGQTFNVQVPSVAQRAGNFNDICTSSNPALNGLCPHIPGTSTPFPGNKVPINPNGALLLPLIPEPNAPGNFFNLAPVQPTNWREELLRVDHNFNSKVRAMFHYIHDSWDTQTAVPLWTNGTDLPTIGTNFEGPGVSVVARLTATASPTLLNEFVFSYTTDHIILFNTGFPDPNAWKRPASMTMGTLFGTGSGVIPGISLQDAGDIYGGGSLAIDAGYIPNGIYNSNPSYTFRDNVTKIVGRHNLQFGAYSAIRQKNELGGELGPGGVGGFLTFRGSNSTVGSGNAFADLLMGNVSSFGQQNRAVKYYNRSKTLEPYFQDDWRVTDRLTLNLGMRISMYGVYKERYHNAFNFDPTKYNLATAPTLNADGSLNLTGGKDRFDGIVQCGVSGAPDGCMEGHLFNPAPRFGFAFDPAGNGKTAIRGGYGIFFEQTNGNEANTESLENSPPGVLAATQSNIASTFGPSGALLASGYNGIGAAGAIFPLTVNSIPREAIWPYVQQWHLDVQREIVKNTVATVSYVGSKGTHLGRQVDLNQLLPVPLSDNPFKPGEVITDNVCKTNTTPSGVAITPGMRAFQNLRVACGDDANFFRSFRGYADINSLENKASSVYHAFQSSLRHTVGGLHLNFAYTYSHSIDDSSDRFDGTFVNSFNPAFTRATSNFDQRHILNIGYVYDLPFFKGSGLTNTLLGGWQWSGIVSYQTGTPFSVTNSVFGDSAGVANGTGTGSYADRVGDPRSGIDQAAAAQASLGPLIYNPAAYAQPQGLTFGNSGRNSLTNPSRTNVDMALFKRFNIKERAAVEFRGEAFNIFNHTSWLPLGGNNGTGNDSLDCSFGGACLSSSSFLHASGAHLSRILQLGLKFIF